MDVLSECFLLAAPISLEVEGEKYQGVIRPGRKEAHCRFW
jgi:hypothetical protein